MTMKKILCALLVFGSVAFSCAKYDDTEIKDAIAELEKKVEALQKLDKEVDALQSMVKGIVSIVSYKEEDGRTSVVLSNGAVLDFTSGINHIPVVTIIKIDHVSVWAYYLDGDIVPFKTDGQYVPVSGHMPEMRVGQNGFIELSVDKGKTWIETQVEMPASIFSGLEVEDDSVVLTLADGYTQVRVPLLKESELQFVSFSGKQFFTAGQTKTIPVGMIGIESYTVTEKPEGWKATLSDGQLKVTAPAEGTGEQSGYIKMLGIGKEPKIAQVYVTIAKAPVLLSVSSDMTVSITPNPQTCFYGACLLEEFDAKAIAAELSGVYNPMMSRYPFASSAMTFPLSNMLQSVEEGQTYVVWVLPATGGACTELDIIYEAVSSIGVISEVTDVTFENARISVNVKGTANYYLVPDITVGDLMTDLAGSYAASYNKYYHDSMFRGSLTDLVEAPLAGAEYSFLVLPVKFGKPLKDDAYEFKVKLNGLTPGGNAAISLEQTGAEYKNLSLKVSATGAYKYYLAVVSEADYTANGYADDQTLLTYLSSLKGSVYNGEYTYKAQNLESGSKYYALAVAIDQQGNLGAPSRLSVSTKAVEYTDAVVTIGQIQSSQTSAVIPLTSNGDIVTYRYMFIAGNGSNYWYYTYVDDDAAAENALIFGTAEYVDVDAAAAAAGIAFEDLAFGVNYIFRVVGYDKNGKVTHLAKADVAPTVGAVVKYGDQWLASAPTVKASIIGTMLELDIKFPGEITQAKVTMISSEQYGANFPTTARLKTDFVLGHDYTFTIGGSVKEYTPEGWYISADIPYILVAWEDAEGWHEPLVYDIDTDSILNK